MPASVGSYQRTSQESAAVVRTHYGDHYPSGRTVDSANGPERDQAEMGAVAPVAISARSRHDVTPSFRAIVETGHVKILSPLCEAKT